MPTSPPIPKEPPSLKIGFRIEIEKINLKNLFPETDKSSEELSGILALFILGILESLNNGLMSTSDVLETFFHVDNILFVRQHLRDRTADEIMSRGVQLPDLFDILPAGEAQREFQRELIKMRTLCLALLEGKPMVV